MITFCVCNRYVHFLIIPTLFNEKLGVCLHCIDSSLVLHKSRKSICSLGFYLLNQVIRGADHVADALAELKGKGYDDTVLLGDETVQEDEGFTAENSETLWECHGWKFVYEFIDRIPQMDAGRDYCFYFELTEEKYGEGLEFPMFMIATMLPRVDADELAMGCNIKRSTDGQNHFILMRRK